jgi:hypothetical protein
MTAPRRGQRRSRKPPSQRRNRAEDLWRPVPPPETPEPIKPASAPRALIESLAPPPLGGQSSTAEYYLAAVVERAAAMATALAASAGVLAEDPPNAL